MATADVGVAATRVGAIAPCGVAAWRVAFTRCAGSGSRSNWNSGPPGPSWMMSPGVIAAVPTTRCLFRYVPLRLFRSTIENL